MTCSAPGYTRRKWLTLGAGAAASVATPVRAVENPRSFQFAYLTDIHVQPERGAADGLTKCIAAVNALDHRPDFTLTGGDLIMDALDVDSGRLRVQWKLFKERWKAVELPSHHTIGNHDVGGWSAKSLIAAGDADYGKKYFAEHLGSGKTFRSFDHQGWHLILLDSIGQNPETRDYFGWIDEAQMEWLKNDLVALRKGTPVVIVTHIPLFSAWGQMNADPRKGENPKALVNNAHVVRKLFAWHNIKLVLSGHGHILERIEFGGVTYIQGGAVCGMWWKGPVFGNPEGFAVVTCHDDGTFDFNYRGYGWKVVA